MAYALKGSLLPAVRKLDCRATRVEAEEGGSFMCVFLSWLTAVPTCRITKGVSYDSFAKVTPGMSLLC